jgi:hypothetical protein
MRVEQLCDLLRCILDFGFHHCRSVVLRMRLDLRQQTRMVDGVIRQLVALLSQLLPFGLALLPRSHPGGHEESSIEMMFLQNGANEIEMSVDAVIEGEGDGGDAVLWPARYGDGRCCGLSGS